MKAPSSSFRLNRNKGVLSLSSASSASVSSEHRTSRLGSWIGSFRKVVADSHVQENQKSCPALSLGMNSAEFSTTTSLEIQCVDSTSAVTSEFSFPEMIGSSSGAKENAQTSDGSAIASRFQPSKSLKKYNYMLIDLGSAIGKQDAAEEAGANISLALQTFSDTAFVGTPAYASPESFLNQVCDVGYSQICLKPSTKNLDC